MDKEKYYNNKYSNFLNILIFFLEGGYLEEDNKETIKKFCENCRKKTLEKTIQEGQELLELDPFPWEWMVDMGQLLNSQINQYVGHLVLSHV